MMHRCIKAFFGAVYIDLCLECWKLRLLKIANSPATLLIIASTSKASGQFWLDVDVQTLVDISRLRFHSFSENAC